MFNERGYARATIREIAHRAGVTHGLVMRHFGCKEQLLLQALPGPRAITEVTPGDLDTLPERIAAGFVAQTEPAGRGQTPFAVAMIRSAASGDEGAMPLYAAAEREVTRTFRQALGPGTEVYARPGELAGHRRHVHPPRRPDRAAELTPEELTAYLVPAFRAMLGPAIAAAHAAADDQPDKDVPGESTG